MRERRRLPESRAGGREAHRPSSPAWGRKRCSQDSSPESWTRLAGGALPLKDEEKKGGREGSGSCFLLSVSSFPLNRNLRVLEPPGGNVIGERRLAKKPENDDVSKVLSGWPPWDHSLPGRSPGYQSQDCTHLQYRRRLQGEPEQAARPHGQEQNYPQGQGSVLCCVIH